MMLDSDHQIKALQQEVTQGFLRFATIEGFGLMAVVAIWYFGKQNTTFLVTGLISVIVVCGWFFLRPVLGKVSELAKLKAEKQS